MRKMLTHDGVALLLVPGAVQNCMMLFGIRRFSNKWLKLFTTFDLSKVRTYESVEYYLEQLEDAGFFRSEAKPVMERGGKELDANGMIEFLRGWVPHLTHLKLQKQSDTVQTAFLADVVKLYFSRMGKDVTEKVEPSIMQNKIVAYASAIAFFQRKKGVAHNLEAVAKFNWTAKL